MRLNQQLVCGLLLLLSSGAAAARACTCEIRKAPCAQFKETSVVFVGVVQSLDQATREEQGEDYPFNGLKAHFRVEEALKGVKSSELDIYTSEQGTACGFPFKAGERYLVYAFRLKDSDAEAGPGASPRPLILGTSICTRTRRAADVREEISILRSLAAGETVLAIYGTVKEITGGIYPSPMREEKPMAGMTVVARRGRLRREAVTDEEGGFAFRGLEPGKYELDVVLPPTRMVGGDYWEERGGPLKKIEATVAANDCPDMVEIWTRVDGRVRGRVYESGGKPAGEDVRVSLVSLDRMIEESGEREYVPAYTRKDGSYEFRGIPPGKYLLGINLDVKPHKDNPYPVTYYPRGGDAARAAVIELAEGQRLSDYDIYLPPRLEWRTVRGKVLRENGEPAAGVIVYVSNKARADFDDFAWLKTDAQGQFIARGLEGITYTFQAMTRGQSLKLEEESERVGLKVQAVTEPLVLVLKPKR